MCGRYTLTTEEEQLADEFELIEPIRLVRRYNIAPTQFAPVIRAGEGGGTRIDMLRWGFVPSWSKEGGSDRPLINARSETAASSPVFRKSMRSRRCIVPASGFFEWRKVPSGPKVVKEPHYIRRIDEHVLGLAGIWDSWRPNDGEVVSSFAILTTTPNELIRTLHDRMPVILQRSDYATWLAADVDDAATLAPLLRPFPADGLTAFPVSQRVNRATVDDAACIQPRSATGSLFSDSG